MDFGQTCDFINRKLNRKKKNRNECMTAKGTGQIIKGASVEMIPLIPVTSKISNRIQAI